ncbi:MAG: hypothetical protein RR306_03810 [Clostridia bacterium]
MKKILFYPLWKAEELENRLHNFELNGWRLKGVTYSYVFDFVKSSAKNSNYIITYDMAKDNSPCMYEYEQKLLTDYSANMIQTKFTGFDIFRVTGDKRAFDDLKNYRRNYFKHVLFQYMLISAIFFITGIGLLFCDNITTIIRNSYFISKYLYFYFNGIFFI